MKLTWLISSILTGFLGLVIVSTSADEPDWKLQVDLVDGCRIIGTPSQESLRVDVGFDELAIPMKRIRRVDWNDDGETVRIELVNRDVLTGHVFTEPVELETIFGKVTLSMKHFKAIEVVPTNLTGWLPTQKGLVLYYAFDRMDDGRLRNLATDAHHARLHGARWIEQGVRGGGMELGGASRIEVAHHADLCPGMLTVAAWIYPHGQQANYQVVLAKSVASSWNQGFGLVRLSGDAKHLHFYVNDYSSFAAKAEIPSDRWSHVAGVCNGRTVSVYLNGRLADSVPLGSHSEPPDDPPPMSEPINHSTTPFSIGSEASGGYPWNGKIDELVMYRRALSDQEVLRLYEAGSLNVASQGK